MEKFLKPQIFASDPDSSSSSQEWSHWKSKFQSFISCLDSPSDAQQLSLLVNLLSTRLYLPISKCTTFVEAVFILDGILLHPINSVFARYKLHSSTQTDNQTLSQYVRQLEALADECDFKDVVALENRKQHILDSFVQGIRSSYIRQRLLENKANSLEEMLTLAYALESAQVQSDQFRTTENQSDISLNHSSSASINKIEIRPSNTKESVLHTNQLNCYFCGRARHYRTACPAKNATCYQCGKKGHFASVCKSSKTSHITATLECLSSRISPRLSNQLMKCTETVEIQSQQIVALIDTGSTHNFIDSSTVHLLNLSKLKCNEHVVMATKSTTKQITEYCIVDMVFNGISYKTVKFFAMDRLCFPVIIGLDFLSKLKSLTLNFNGQSSSVQINHIQSAKLEAPDLFPNLPSNVKPIASKSRRYNYDDLGFIRKEIQNLQNDGIIEQSRSPWRSQVLVVRSQLHKPRMVIDYSRTINYYTQLDAYPLPNIQAIIDRVSTFKVFSRLDLSSAYHQVSIRKQDRPYTAFEANGRLWQFCRLPFGITNAVPCFQRLMDSVIEEKNLTGTYAYLDDIIICGNTVEEHNERLNCFMKIANSLNLTISKQKSEYQLETICFLGYLISQGTIRPDPSRVKPLMEMQNPHDQKSLKRMCGMFAHYAKWIENFSLKIKPLLNVILFPLNDEVTCAIKNLKNDIASASLAAIDPYKEFVVETDASNCAIGAILSQDSRPVAFFSRSLSNSQRKQSAIELEAMAVVESVRYWRHHLTNRPFKLITDQRSVSMMFGNHKCSKIKADKFARWKIELSPYRFDIIYRPGSQNECADALSRDNAILCNANVSHLYQLHDKLCHAGIIRLHHYVKTMNLPYGIDDIREMVGKCKICRRLKPRFYQPAAMGQLVKATRPFERLNIDFKGPMPSNNENIYALCIIDEYSRFPFVFPCRDMSSTTVIKCLKSLFCMFGPPAYIHSDRGKSFMSNELREFLFSHGTAQSHSSAYHPQGNGLVERYNGIIWSSITASLESCNLPIENWQDMLPQALNAVRSLLSTSTNFTPHERMFGFQRRMININDLPHWLIPNSSVWMKNDRAGKYDNKVDEAIVIASNPYYSRVSRDDGKIVTVSNSKLAQGEGSIETNENNPEASINDFYRDTSNVHSQNSIDTCSQNDECTENINRLDDNHTTCKPTRQRRLPSYLRDYEVELHSIEKGEKNDI